LHIKFPLICANDRCPRWRPDRRWSRKRSASERPRPRARTSLDGSFRTWRDHRAATAPGVRTASIGGADRTCRSVVVRPAKSVGPAWATGGEAAAEATWSVADRWTASPLKQVLAHGSGWRGFALDAAPLCDLASAMPVAVGAGRSPRRGGAGNRRRHACSACLAMVAWCRFVRPPPSPRPTAVGAQRRRWRRRQRSHGVGGGRDAYATAAMVASNGPGLDRSNAHRGRAVSGSVSGLIPAGRRIRRRGVRYPCVAVLS
jgi:hypothetical protein